MKTTLILLCFVATIGQAQIEQYWATNDGDIIKWNRLAHASKTDTANHIWVGNNDTVKIFGARNETVAFQLVLQAGTSNATGITVELPSLYNGTTAIQNRNSDPTRYDGRYIEIFREHFHWVASTERASTYPPWENEAGGNGWSNSKPMPDTTWTGFLPYGCVPIEAPSGFYSTSTRGPRNYTGQGGQPFTCYSAANEVLWFDIYIPKWATSGMYYGTITIKQNGTSIRTIPIKMGVYNFTLSDTTHLQNYHFCGPQLFKDVMGLPLTSGGGDYYYGYGGNATVWDAYKKAKQMFHRHRMDLVLSHAPIDTIYKRMSGFFRGWQYDSAYGYGGPARGIGDQVYSIGNYLMGVFDSRRWYNISQLGPYGDDQSGWAGMATDFQRFFKDSAASVYRFIYLMDEPARRPAYPSNEIIADMETRIGWIRNSGATGFDLPSACSMWLDPVVANWTSSNGHKSTVTLFFETGQMDAWFGYHTVPVGDDGVSGNYSVEEIRALESTGPLKLKVGNYNGYRGGISNPQHLDTPLIDATIQPWMYWRNNVDMAYFWETAFWGYGKCIWDPVQQVCTDHVPQDGWENFATDYQVWGEGNWVLAGRDFYTPAQDRGLNMLIASTRMKAYRRGLQNVEYLWLAQQQGKENLKAPAGKTWNTIINYYAAFDDFRYSQHQPNQYPSYSEKGTEYERLRWWMAESLGSIEGGGAPPEPPPDPPPVTPLIPSRKLLVH